MTVVIPAGFEQKLFRRINALVEPAVRRGVASPTMLPAGLIVLESIGFKSGQQRSTPLLSFRIGRYRIVSTVRGDRSFWVKNLIKQSRVHYFVGGRRREADAIVLLEGKLATPKTPLSPFLNGLVTLFSYRIKKGLAVTILAPVKT